MGYMHIESLYKCPEFFQLFPEIYCMEKIHGTSTWIRYERGQMLKFHSGGESGESFKAIFNEEFLKNKLDELSIKNNWTIIKIHGEGYGGRQQGMSKTYGDKLKFIVFDIYVESNDNGPKYLNIPDAEKIAQDLQLEFVYYVRGLNTPEWIEEQSNQESIQAIRNGLGSGKPREGVVVRPIIESVFSNGQRAITKHKNAEFWEIKTRRPLGERLKVVEGINEIVEDWVTGQRFNHVVDRVLQQKVNKALEKSDIKILLDLMVEDVKRESEGEVIWSDKLVSAIRRKTAIIFKNYAPHLNLK
ncbi:RNA ligase 2 [Acanthamoeba polyphaga moumouvirus]|uniref:RNA ligase 2 n=1 Tax=Acanthamoeba polyphaga moumouvirus TaxID=1269028 RepID=L7RCH8_9VIRU|nr:RNA ligase 2 [Acanthamoeba polyphaga moumouvirus]AGC01678.1 RNA ligase 2 [Acanthamoeba polyphaga moumouvirus]AQN68016.1 RNA ligase 2 [Saudi moumouvirus]